METPPSGSMYHYPARHQQQVVHADGCSPGIRHPSSSGGGCSQDSPVATESEYNMLQMAQMQLLAQQQQQQQQLQHQFQQQQQQQSYGHSPQQHLGQHLDSGRQQQVSQPMGSLSGNFYDPLAHSSLFTAALADPTGSLSHIDLGILSAPTLNPPCCQAMSLNSNLFSLQPSMDFGSLLGGGIKDEEERVGAEHGSPFLQHQHQPSRATDANKSCGTIHPEVGDIIGDGSVSHEFIISHFKEYANRVGFVMTRNFDNVDSKGRYRRVRVACKQGGLPRKTTKHENPAMQRERTSQKVGCPFEVTVWRTKQRPGGMQAQEESWVVTNVKGINHGPCPLLGNICHPLSKAHDGIHKEAQDQIKAQIKKTQLANQHPKRSGQSSVDPRMAQPAPIKSLARFLSERVAPEERCDTMLLLMELTSACKRIADGLTSAAAWTEQPPHFANMAINSIKSALASLPCVHTLAVHPETEVSKVDDGGRFSVAVDSLVGAEDSALGSPYGTVFGVYRAVADTDKDDALLDSDLQSVVQAGSEQVAAGYVLYSHPPTLVLALGGEGGGSHVFSLDRSSGDFVLARPDFRVPQRGQRCTVLESDRQLWPAALRQYVDVVGRAEGESKAPYAVTTSRSLLADFHATLKEGGVLVDPVSRPGLVYRFNPLSLVMEQAGGGATDGAARLLGLLPVGLTHQTAVCFGSQTDVSELGVHLSGALPSSSC